MHSIFAPRPFSPPVEEHEAPAAGPGIGFNFADISIFPRETVQPKLVLGPVGDRYEQEADRVARQVVDTISSSDQGAVQRQEDEDELDLEELDEEEELRLKVAGIAPAGGADVEPGLESAIRWARSGGQSLSDRVRQPMERAFGADFGEVRVHADGEADSLNRSIQARAFTTGHDIFLRQGEYRPASTEGQRLLAHELTHVVQQNGSPSHRLEEANGGVNTVRRILETVKQGQTIFVSTCDKTTVIDANNAAITVAATRDDSTGGHAEIYLELFENGVAAEYTLDMIGTNDSKAMVRIKRFNMGQMNCRGKGGFTTYSIPRNQADMALVAAANLKIQGENGTLKYNYYLSKIWNLNLLSVVTYMNCADFAEHILRAAGVAGASGGIFSKPKTLASQ